MGLPHPQEGPDAGDTTAGQDPLAASRLQRRQRNGRDYLVLRNEFATVWIELRQGPSGVVLEVTDPEAETCIALDPLELEAISRMGHRDFDPWILNRGGPPFDAGDEPDH